MCLCSNLSNSRVVYNIFFIGVKSRELAIPNLVVEFKFSMVLGLVTLMNTYVKVCILRISKGFAPQTIPVEK